MTWREAQIIFAARKRLGQLGRNRTIMLARLHKETMAYRLPVHTKKSLEKINAELGLGF